MTELIDSDGRVTRWPRQAIAREKVLQYLAEKFEPGRQYPEKEVNDILKRFHTFGDWALLRRELFEAGKLGRDPKLAQYWRL